jgi:hypothetical protein
VRIYVASSWRNEQQQGVVAALRSAGHEVYDFKHPRPGDNGFYWSEIDPAWKSWSPEQYRSGLEHPVARAGFGSDMAALEWCDACVLVLPCGRSAHLELGWAAGAGKRTLVLMAQPEEPELMYRMLHGVCVSVEEVVARLAASAAAEGEGTRCAACGHDHAAGGDNEDVGCIVCFCKSWRAAAPPAQGGPRDEHDEEDSIAMVIRDAEIAARAAGLLEGRAQGLDLAADMLIDIWDDGEQTPKGFVPAETAEVVLLRAEAEKFRALASPGTQTSNAAPIKE